MEQRTVYDVRTNSDLTEGRGEYVIHTCALYSTAKRLGRQRYVQGSDCPIDARLVDYDPETDNYYGKISVDRGSAADAVQEEKRTKLQAAIERAQALGLSEDDIKTIQGG
jgi:hypothetical protein